MSRLHVASILAFGLVVVSWAGTAQCDSVNETCLREFDENSDMRVELLQRSSLKSGGYGMPDGAEDWAPCKDEGYCKHPNMKCYMKNSHWAQCMPSCVKGINSSEPEQYRTPWRCTILGESEPDCGETDGYCLSTKCCKDSDQNCYTKNEHWAICMRSCEVGIHQDEPKEYQNPWACDVLNVNSATATAIQTPATREDCNTCMEQEILSCKHPCRRQYWRRGNKGGRRGGRGGKKGGRDDEEEQEDACGQCVDERVNNCDNICPVEHLDGCGQCMKDAFPSCSKHLRRKRRRGGKRGRKGGKKGGKNENEGEGDDPYDECMSSECGDVCGVN